MRSYTGLLEFSTLEDRFEYLKLSGEVGCPTFGSARQLNQAFYTSRVWRDLREHILLRDMACDLGVEDYDIHDRRRAIVHHLNPLTVDDIMRRSRKLFDPENLITTTHDTHNAIHYGDVKLLPRPHVERYEGDTLDYDESSFENTFPGSRGLPTYPS